MRDLAHVMEDVLAQARTAGEFPAQLVEPLLRGADALRRHVAGDDEPTPDLLEDLAASLASAFGRVPADSAVVAEPTPAAPAADRRAIRVPAEKIDRLLDLVGETVLHRRRLEHVIGDDRGGAGQTVSDELDLGGRLLRRAQGRRDRDAHAAARDDHGAAAARRTRHRRPPRARTSSS